MACCQRDELLAPVIKEGVRADDKRVGIKLDESCERGVDLAFLTGL